MITIKIGILIILGTIFLTAEMITLLRAKTNVKAKPMPNPFIADVVVANVGQVPNTKTNTGFS